MIKDQNLTDRIALGKSKPKAHTGTVVRAATVVFLLCAITSFASAQTYTTLFSFDGVDGGNPVADLVQGFDGNLYGITPSGGRSLSCAGGCGTVFQLGLAGTVTTIYEFCLAANCPDGELPYGSLMLGRDGNFYGLTAGGGANGFGTAFEITSAGRMTTLYSFCAEANCGDGGGSIAGLVQAANGNFYGTTTHGGSNNACPSGCGTIFELSRTGGKLTTIYNFCSQPKCTDGQYPTTNLVQTANGSLYGTTGAGGNPICTNGCGTVFRISPTGMMATIYTFCAQSACVDGQLPEAGLVQGADGNLYGTTSYGGTRNSGTVFEVSPTGSLTTLHSFCPSDCSDGAYPYSPVILASDGNLYGTTEGGGAYSHGAIFEITRTGNLTTLYSFCAQDDCLDGAYPYNGLMQATDGTFYGTTNGGGANNNCSLGCGTIFSLSTGLAPFVETLPIFGRVGESVTVLGKTLTGATGVSFNGIPASFTVISDSEIKATVPAGATTGKVKVSISRQTLASNVAFHVKP